MYVLNVVNPVLPVTFNDVILLSATVNKNIGVRELKFNGPDKLLFLKLIANKFGRSDIIIELNDGLSSKSKNFKLVTPIPLIDVND